MGPPHPLLLKLIGRKSTSGGIRFGDTHEVQTNLESQSNLEIYLSVELHPHAEESHILVWLKINVVKYPIFREITHNILAISISTVDSESAFSMGGHILPFRSSLFPNTVDALICTQN